MTSVREIFSSGPEFCNLCGSILPLVTGSVVNSKCSACSAPIIRTNSVSEKEQAEGIIESISYVVHFNDRNFYSKQKAIMGDQSKKRKKKTAEGPVVARDCKMCGYNKMAYSTLQLRSADEGQTVFFTCLKCGHKENENS